MSAKNVNEKLLKLSCEYKANQAKKNFVRTESTLTPTDVHDRF